MRKIRISDPQARELIEGVIADRECMPVRRLEALQAKGEAGMGMIVVALREALERRRALPLQWCAAALGHYGDPAVIPDLTHLLRVAWCGRNIGLGFAAAEAIGRMGSDAERMLLEHAALTPRAERYWFHYAAARAGTDGVAEFLMDELEGNVQLADIAALALADMGRTALPAIDRVMARVRPWQIAGMEMAVLSMARGEPVLGRYATDWRLRYRYTAGLGHFPSAWPCVMALLRTHARGRRAAAAGHIRRRTSSIVETAPRPRSMADRCKSCGMRRARARMGLLVCDTCAPALARQQAESLLDVHRESNDIFDVLDTLDSFFMKRDQRPLPSDASCTRYARTHAACFWLIEQGIESTAAGAATLLAEGDGGAARPDADGES